MKEKVTLEKNVPIPSKFRKRKERTGSFKWEVIRSLIKLKVGESLFIEGRAGSTVSTFYLWIPEGITGNKYHLKMRINDEPDKNRVWRIK